MLQQCGLLNMADLRTVGAEGGLGLATLQPFLKQYIYPRNTWQALRNTCLLSKVHARVEVFSTRQLIAKYVSLGRSLIFLIAGYTSHTRDGSPYTDTPESVAKSHLCELTHAVTMYARFSRHPSSFGNPNHRMTAPTSQQSWS